MFDTKITITGYRLRDITNSAIPLSRLLYSPALETYKDIVDC